MSSKGPIARTLEESKSFIFLIIIVIGLFAAGYYTSRWQTSDDYELLSQEKEALLENLKLAKNKTTNITSLLENKDRETQELKEIIRGLKEAPAKIKYIVKTKTVIKGGETNEVVTVTNDCPNPPPGYQFKFENGLPVAEFRVKKEANRQTYQYETADITFKTAIVIAEDKTGVLLKASSSLEPGKEFTLIAEDVTVSKIKQFSIFEPHVMLGITTSMELVPVTLDVTGTLSLPLLHLLDKRFDMLAPKISFNGSSARLGLDIASYNIGHDIPIITDLWLTIGSSVDFTSGQSYPSIDLSVGSKL